MKLTEEQIHALKELLKDSGKKGNLPNSGIIIEDEKIIAKAGSYVASNTDVTAHSELMMIQEVCKREKTISLNKYSIVTVFEPCLMCLCAAYWVGIKNIYFIIPSKKYVNEIPWCIDSEKINKKGIALKFKEPVNLIHLSEYEEYFSKLFDEYSKKVRKLKRN